MLVILRKPGPGALNLPAAALFLPGKPAAALKLRPQDVAQGRKVEDIQRGVIKQFLWKRAFGPVGLLAFLGQDNAKMMFEQRRKSEPWQIEQLRPHHRVKQAVRRETAEIVKQAQVEIAAVHDQMLGRQTRPEAVERKRSNQVDQEDLPADHDLQQADARTVAEKIVGLGVDRDLVDAVQGIE